MKPDTLKQLAHQFMVNTIKAGSGKNIWIEYVGPECLPLATACISAVEAVGSHAFAVDRGSAALNGWLSDMSFPEIATAGETLLRQMKKFQGYIRICDDADSLCLTIDGDRKAAWDAALHDVTEYRVNNTDWLVVSAPSATFANACKMALPEFEKFYTDVCLVDYSRMAKAAAPLRQLLTDSKSVHLKGLETDLHFSIAGINAVACSGRHNIPDGECFTAPVKQSVNGTILFGPSVYDGQYFSSIKLKFEDGRIVDAKGDTQQQTAAINRILDRDAGARYVGEFAIAYNPYVLHPTGDILFDEKISGSLHFTPGNCYDDADNGNKSQVHWDMVHIQRPDYGGGEIWLDGHCIRKDGLFITPELLALNPENLMMTQ